MPFEDGQFDFAYCNPPFYQLERYSDAGGDLAAHRTLGDWLTASGEMMVEMRRVVKPGGLIVTVIADCRKDGALVSLAGPWIAEAQRQGLILHDVVIERLLSQQLRMWRQAYKARRTARAHEYVITFKVPERGQHGG